MRACRNNEKNVKQGLIVGLLIAASVLAITLAPAADDPAPAKTDPAQAKTPPQQPLKSIFDQRKPAKNPKKLVAIVDRSKVLGWISGSQEYSGRQVTITYGSQERTVIVQQGNTFTWHYRVDKPVDATFACGPLKASVRLEPTKASAPTVFFVVDRTAYRPQQTVHFAGFLRSVDRRGEFTPLGEREVELRVTAKNKKTVAARLKLTSDKFGRISGQYRFQQADALDTYELSIPDYEGTAEVKLAEFRKAKVRLTIDSKLEGQDLKLNFQAVDFLNKPVPGSKVRFTAQIVKDGGSRRELPLTADQFVYHDSTTLNLFDEELVDDDQRLLWEAGILTTAQSMRGRAQAVAQNSGDINVSEDGSGEHTIKLQSEWTKGPYSVVVQGVLTDYNGREQRATKTISIGTKVKDCDLVLSTVRRHYETGETIRVHVQPLDADGKPVEAKASLIAMRLAPAAPNHNAYGYRYGYGYSYGHNIYGGRFPTWRSQNIRFRSGLGWNAGWAHVPSTKSASREMVTAAVVSDGTADLKIDEPGPYKLVCVAELPDGRKLKNEVGVVVVEPEQMPPLVLKLDADQFATGDILGGEIHSLYHDARVLLTLRDSVGVRFWKTIDLKDGVARLHERLPADIRYGCNVEIQFIDQGGQDRICSRFIRVEPTDRIVDIKTRLDKTYQPGEYVTVDVQVDRQQPVDLVVSVYDQSLLGVAADKSVDIRNFYLADERVRQTAARDLLRRRLGNVTIKELVAQADELLKAEPELAKTAAASYLQHAVNSYRASSQIYVYHLLALLDSAGIPVQLHPIVRYYGHHWYYGIDKKSEAESPVRVIDLLAHQRSQWQLKYHLVGDTLMLSEFHPSYAQQYSQLALGNGLMLNQRGYGGLRTRGDAHFSVSANGFFSHQMGGMASGQAFMSHLPGPLAPVELIGSDEPGVSVRRDFSDSAFWNANLRTDSNGKARVKFKLPDSLTNWHVVVTAISSKMHVGQTKASFRTFKPVMVWPMVPRIFSEGDQVELYASVHNRTDKPQEIDVSLKVKNGEVLTDQVVRVHVPANDQRPVYWTFRPGEAGFTQLLMTARSKAGSDASLKRLPVARMAAEQVVTRSGFARDKTSIVIPSFVNLDDSVLEVTLVPTLADDMSQSLDYLVQYPYGCVEQTMSRFLPAIKVAQTLKRVDIANPSLEKKLPDVVQAGIKRLLDLQQPDGGWGWHRGGATHEMMTPYALYGLLQAEKAGYTIPNEQAVGKGLTRLKQFIDSMGEGQVADRIYCMYVYSHRGEIADDWWKFIEDQRKKEKLSDYATAMALEMTINKKGLDGLEKKLVEALQRRVHKQDDMAYWTTAGFSRWGQDRFEITAAVLKALVAHDNRAPLIEPVLNFFANTKTGNRWNSTKSTAMVIYALCDYMATQDYHAGNQRELTVQVNDEEPQTSRLEVGRLATVQVPGRQLKHGHNVISFQGHVPGALYRAVFRYWEKGGQIEPMESGLQVVRQFYLLDENGKQAREIKPGDNVPRGSYIQSVVSVKHKQSQNMRYVLVENPKPATCEILPITDKRFAPLQQSTRYALREDKTAGVFYHHEQTGANIIDRCVLHAELAGNYLVPPANVELMYQTQTRGHSGTFQFEVRDEERIGDEQKVTTR